jgi:hypothetical protein
MKFKVALLGIGLAVTSASAQPLLTNTFTLNLNAAIPQGNPVGVRVQFTASGLLGVAANVQVGLNISGGFNGGLFAYLTGPQGQMAVLLNRPGVTASNPYGDTHAGFDITLDGAGLNNIHDYATIGYSLNESGQVTGTWAADGRAIDPQSPGIMFDNAPTAARLQLFDHTDPNGTWTLFVADLVAGVSPPVLNEVNFTIEIVPEPGTMAITGIGAVVLLLRRRR